MSENKAADADFENSNHNQTNKENTMKYEVGADKQFPHEWRVEAIDPKEGDIFVALFAGPDAEKRAREYADWKNGQ